MVELDLVLNAFIDQYFETLNAEQLDNFEKLLAYDDPEIFDWLMGDRTAEDLALHELIECLRSINLRLKTLK